MRRVKIVLRMLRNRFLSGDATLASGETPWIHKIAFVLNFFPPYNLACWLWVRACGGWLRGSPAALGLSRAMMRRGFLFGALRHATPEQRNAFAAAALLPELRVSAPAPAASPQAAALTAEVTGTGFASLGSLLSDHDAEAAVRYFRAQSGYASQTPLQSDGVLRPFEEYLTTQGRAERYFCYSSKTSLGCPQVRQVVNNPLLRQVAASYLGFTPVLFSVNTIVTIKGDSEHYVMRMHRDYDAFASVTFFVYWTDVAADNGATIYIPQSHRSSQVDPQSRVYLTGQAGQVFALDTFGLHAGNKSVAGYRFATWCRFGSAPNLATIQDPDLVPALSPALLPG